MSQKLENGILSEGMDGKYQGYFLNLTLVSNTRLFVLLLPIKKIFYLGRGENKNQKASLLLLVRMW